MKSLFLLLLISCFMFNGYAQPKNQTVEVSSGTDLESVVDNQLQYAFEDFTDGVILHGNGEISKVKLNYSYLHNEMQYLEPSSGEIMALKGNSDITVISISGRKFVPGVQSQDFLELINDKGDIFLGVKRTCKALSMGKKGAYGTSNMAGSVTSVDQYETGANNVGSQSYDKLSVSEDLRISMDNMYYLINHKNGKNTYVSGVKTFQKIYPKDKSAPIEQYVAKNSVDFKNENDLNKLVDYCNQL